MGVPLLEVPGIFPLTYLIMSIANMSTRPSFILLIPQLTDHPKREKLPEPNMFDPENRLPEKTIPASFFGFRRLFPRGKLAVSFREGTVTIYFHQKKTTSHQLRVSFGEKSESLVTSWHMEVTTRIVSLTRHTLSPPYKLVVKKTRCPLQ